MVESSADLHPDVLLAPQWRYQSPNTNTNSWKQQSRKGPSPPQRDSRVVQNICTNTVMWSPSANAATSSGDGGGCGYVQNWESTKHQHQYQQRIRANTTRTAAPYLDGRERDFAELPHTPQYASDTLEHCTLTGSGRGNGDGDVTTVTYTPSGPVVESAKHRGCHQRSLSCKAGDFDRFIMNERGNTPRRASELTMKHCHGSQGSFSSLPGDFMSENESKLMQQQPNSSEPLDDKDHRKSSKLAGLPNTKSTIRRTPEGNRETPYYTPCTTFSKIVDNDIDNGAIDSIKIDQIRREQSIKLVPMLHNGKSTKPGQHHHVSNSSSSNHSARMKKTPSSQQQQQQQHAQSKALFPLLGSSTLIGGRHSPAMKKDLASLRIAQHPVLNKDPNCKSWKHGSKKTLAFPTYEPVAINVAAAEEANRSDRTAFFRSLMNKSATNPRTTATDYAALLQRSVSESCMMTSSAKASHQRREKKEGRESATSVLSIDSSRDQASPTVPSSSVSSLSNTTEGRDLDFVAPPPPSSEEETTLLRRMGWNEFSNVVILTPQEIAEFKANYSSEKNNRNTEATTAASRNNAQCKSCQSVVESRSCQCSPVGHLSTFGISMDDGGVSDPNLSESSSL